jgi:hypothetical protein
MGALAITGGKAVKRGYASNTRSSSLYLSAITDQKLSISHQAYPTAESKFATSSSAGRPDLVDTSVDSMLVSKSSSDWASGE